ncbi:Uma2 family endonuclease [Tsukamurella sp. NPDC003166]|uniref:Uma2 family endonuclease n=1 Tax=Tsukamurella sp. NPDC003166 TaxID=3154444 RepID=UPI0033A8A44E
MAAPVHDEGFDPLMEFAGGWTTELAERYLPIEGAPAARYECLGGRLVVSPVEGAANSWGELELAAVMRLPARAAGYVVYNPLNVLFDDRTWIVPDLVVLREPAGQVTWVPVERVLMPVDFVSPGSGYRDRCEKPALCAAARIPYFLRVEIDGKDVEVELGELADGEYRVVAHAVSGQEFRTDVPFPMSFDPLELLEPGVAPR